MPGPCQLPIPAEIQLMEEFRFLAPLGMTLNFWDDLELSIMPGFQCSIANCVIPNLTHPGRPV